MSAPESNDLIRRLDAAANSKSLHPNYARELLREAREALSVAKEDPPEDGIEWVAATLQAPEPPYGFFTKLDGDLPALTPTCEVCSGESGGQFVGVACSALGAFSIALCDRCVGNHAEPAGILSAMIYEAGGIDNMAPWVRDLNAWHNGAYVSAADLPLTRERIP